jgi:hypothetical protein
MLIDNLDNSISIGNDFVSAVTGPYLYNGMFTLDSVQYINYKTTLSAEITQRVIEKIYNKKVICFVWQSLK